MNDKTIITIVAVGAITALEVLALNMGINGTVLTASVGALALIVGYNFPTKGKIKGTFTGLMELVELSQALKEEMKEQKES